MDDTTDVAQRCMHPPHGMPPCTGSWTFSESDQLDFVNATMQPGVDITFTDDREGVPCEHPEVQPDLDMSNESLADLQFATQEAGQYLATVLAEKNRTCWDCIGGTQGEHNIQGPPSGAAECVAYMRSLCAPTMQGR